jgi:hypothetical protein
MPIVVLISDAGKMLCLSDVVMFGAKFQVSSSYVFVRHRSTAGAIFSYFRHDMRRRSDYDRTSFCLECEIYCEARIGRDENLKWILRTFRTENTTRP